MTWTDCRTVKGEVLKYLNWKKAQDSKIRIDPKTLSIEVRGGRPDVLVIYDKAQLMSVTIEETREAADKDATESDALCGWEKEVLNLFYCGVMLLLDQKVSNHPLVVNKTQEFQGMIANAKQFLNSGISDYTPTTVPVPPPASA